MYCTDNKTIASDILKKYSLHIVVLLTIIGFLIRVYRLDYLTFWGDAWNHVYPAIRFLKGKEKWANGDTNGSFLTWILIVVFKFFKPNEFVARMPSVIFSTLCIPLIFYFVKRLFKNNIIAIISSALMTFSLYNVAWGRIVRNYASFEFSYLLLLIVAWLLFLPNNQDDSNGIKKVNYLTKIGIHKKYFIIFPFVFIFSLLNHVLTFLFIFGFGFFIIYHAIYLIFKQGKRAFKNPLVYIGGITFIGYIIFTNSYLVDLIARPLVTSIINSKTVVQATMPDWENILKVFNSPDKYKGFNTYYNILKEDFVILKFFGFIGFIGAFFISKKSIRPAMYIFSMFVIQFILMSFVFIDRITPNYLLYIYTLFIVSIACGIYFVFGKIIPFIAEKIFTKNIYKQKLLNYIYIVSLTIIFFNLVPINEIRKLIEIKKHGFVTKRELVHISYVNWKGIINIAKREIKPKDVILTTFTNATNFYFNIDDNSILFRQAYLDVYDRKYKYFEPVDELNNARSLENLKRLFNHYDRGWLFADYYFENVMTDPKCRDFIIKNTEYKFLFGRSSGEIKVFFWDKSKPLKYKNSMLIELGKEDYKQASKKLTFNLPKSKNELEKITFVVETEGIDSDLEAIIVINEKFNKTLKIPNSNEVKNIPIHRYYDGSRMFLVASFNKSELVDGTNTLQFAYNGKLIKDSPKGFVIYNVNIEYTQN